MRLLAPVILGTFLITSAAYLTGCHAAHTGQRSPRPDPTPVIAAHTAKDAAITASTERIDNAVEDTELEQPIRLETKHIREAIRNAPAEQIAKLATSYERVIDLVDDKFNEVYERLQSQQREYAIEQAKAFHWFGIVTLSIFGLLLFLGQIKTAIKGWSLVVLGLGSLGLSQLIAHPWFSKGAVIATSLAISYGIYYIIDYHRKQNAQRHKNLIRAGAMGEIATVLDKAYEEADESFKAILDKDVFGPLSKKMGKDMKAQIHEIRAEDALGKEPAHA